MRFQPMQWALVAAPLFFMTTNANGQLLWSEDFDSYAAGSLIEYQGGWTDWWLGPQGLSQVSNAQALSGANSGAIILGSDTVYNFDGLQGGNNEDAPNCGEWTFTGWVYTPSGGIGQNYFIILNNYNGAGLNTQWSAQVCFNWVTSQVECDCGSGVPDTATLLTDQWVELRVEVDLDQDVLLSTDNTFVFYNNVLLGSYPWSAGVFGQDMHTENKIEALDLYPSPGASTLFWDDLSLTQTATGSCPVGTNYCLSTVNSSGNSATISASGSPSISNNDLVLEATGLPVNNDQPGLFIAGPTQATIPFFNGFLCVNPNGLQRFAVINVSSNGTITEPVDYNTSAAGGLNVAAGMTYNYQRWNRDPAAGGANANFSDGIAIVHTP